MLSKLSKSQGLVEFALILPVLLLTIFVIIELARVLHAWLAVENGARFGVRYAVTREYDSLYCTDSNSDGVCDDPGEEDSARIESIKDNAKVGSVAILRNDSSEWNAPGYYQVTVCPIEDFIPPDPNIPFDSADCDGEERLPAPGKFVSVTVDFNHPLITPMLTAVWPQLHLSSSRQASIESFKTSSAVIPPGGLPSPPPQPPPSPPPPPDCSDIRMSGMTIRGDDVEADIRNDNDATAYLVHTHLEWTKLRSQMYSNEFELDNFEYWSVEDDSSPTDVSSPMGLVPLPGGGNTDRWEGDFNGEPYEPIWGDYRLELTFDFPDWDGGPCTVARSISVEQQPRPPTSTPRPTNTEGPPRPTNTPRPPTRTPGPATNTPKPTSTDAPATDPALPGD